MASAWSALTVLALLGQEGPASIEARAVQALGEGKFRTLRALAAEIAELKPAKRSELPIRIRADVVEFRFRGEAPGERLTPDMLEYVVSDASKDYETLLIVGKAELDRALRLGQALADLTKRGRRPALEVKLAWVENGQPRVEDLRDIFRLVDADQADDFLDRLAPKSAGLEAFNLKADPTALPAKRGPAEVIITIGLPK